MDEVAIGLTIRTETDSMHIRNWYVPPEVAGPFAAYLTGLFGEPDEMITDLETLAAGAERAAGEGRAAFLLHDAEGRDDG